MAELYDNQQRKKNPAPDETQTNVTRTVSQRLILYATAFR